MPRLSMVVAAAMLGTCLAYSEAAPAESMNDALGYLDRYMAECATTIPALVATERYQQTAHIARHQEQRTLVSDFGIIRVMETGEWIGFRDVLQVDAHDVDNAMGMARSLLLNPNSPVEARAAAVMNGSATYNLGQRRTINNPAIAFELFDPQNRPRLRFSGLTQTTLNHERVIQLSFQETARPTIVRTAAGADVPLTGQMSIDTVSKRPVLIEINTVHYALQSAHPPQTIVERGALRLTFANNSDVNAWVPESFTERYTSQGTPVEWGTAEYTNYRRFRVQTDEQLVAPKPTP
jgi:hypothetical protein